MIPRNPPFNNIKNRVQAMQLFLSLYLQHLSPIFDVDSGLIRAALPRTCAACSHHQQSRVVSWKPEKICSVISESQANHDGISFLTVSHCQSTWSHCLRVIRDFGDQARQSLALLMKTMGFFSEKLSKLRAGSWGQVRPHEACSAPWCAGMMKINPPSTPWAVWGSCLHPT